jgi:hypothetical protein
MLSAIFYQIGTITPPRAVTQAGTYATGPGKILQLVMTVIIAVSGVYALINFLLAGLGFIAAGSDPSKIEKAWTKIWQTIVGLLLVAGSFTLAAIVGKLIFNDWTALLTPEIPEL